MVLLTLAKSTVFIASPINFICKALRVEVSVMAASPTIVFLSMSASLNVRRSVMLTLTFLNASCNSPPWLAASPIFLTRSLMASLACALFPPLLATADWNPRNVSIVKLVELLSAFN